MPAYVGGHMSQAEFLGYMSSEAGWNFFVNSILPLAMNFQFAVEGGTPGETSGTAQLLAAVQDAGNNLGGLTIPTAVLEAAKNPTPPAPVATAPTLPATVNDGLEVLRKTLANAGLGDLVDLVTKLNNQGLNLDAIMTQVRGTDLWKDRFAGIVARQKAGLPGGTEGDALAYEQSMNEMLRQYGITGYTRKDYENWYGADVSVAEQSKRANVASTWAYNEPPEARAAAERLYGIHAGDITHYVFDPQNALPAIQRKLDAAQIAGSAGKAGLGALTAGQAEMIGGYTDPASAAAQLAKLGQQTALYASLPGEGANFTVDDLIDAYFGGNAAKLNALRQRANQRQAEFQASGGVLQTAKGALGAGAAQPV